MGWIVWTILLFIIFLVTGNPWALFWLFVAVPINLLFPIIPSETSADGTDPKSDSSATPY